MMSDLADFRGAVLWGLRMGPVGPRPAEPRSLAPTTVVFLPHPQLFNDVIRLAVSYKQNSRDFMDEVLQELEVGQAQVLGGHGNGLSSEGVEHKPTAWQHLLARAPPGGVAAAGRVHGRASPEALSTEL